MRLRTRLIVVFLVVSVVPLGAVTYYAYTSQVRALRELAAREADTLSSEMTARMQLVTAELSTRVEQLADMPADVVRVSQERPVEPTPVVPVPAEPTLLVNQPSTPAVNAMTDEDRVADALGSAAMLLRSVELHGLRRGGRSGNRIDPNAPVDPSAPPRSPPDPNRPRPPRLGGQGTDPAQRPTGGARAGEANAVSGPGEVERAQAEAKAAAGTAAAGNDRIVIDMRAITRDMFSKYVPQGGVESMTPEQRQQMARDINQRMMGIAEGIRMSADQLQKQSEAAKLKQAAAASAGVPPTSPVPATRPVAPTPPSTVPPAAGPAPKMTRSTALVGNRLDVKVSQDGKVVSEVNATVDLDNLLATVFSPTRREKGEVPFAVGPDGKVYTANEDDRKAVEALGPIVRPDGPLGKTTLPDWIVFTTVDPSGSGLRFGIARPVGDSLDALKRTAGRNAGLGLLVIAFAIVGAVPLSGRLTRNLTALTEGVDRIANGDYRARVPVRAKDEIGELAMAFNKMAADVEHHQQAAVEQERLRRELELGRQIQSEMLPREPMLFGLTAVQGISIPAREVGGDFFNYFALDDGTIALLVGDVSGKGVGAALLMANIQASLRTRLAMGQSLAAVADAIDRELAATATTRLYVTLFFGIFDPATRQLQYVNAGHNPQFVLRPNQPIERMAATGIPIGLLAGHGYTQNEVQLASGDLLFFYTDGCVETENESDEMFGSDRLEELLVSLAALDPMTPDRVLHQVEQSVTAFRGTREPFDDATMMAVRIG